MKSKLSDMEHVLVAASLYAEQRLDKELYEIVERLKQQGVWQPISADEIIHCDCIEEDCSTALYIQAGVLVVQDGDGFQMAISLPDDYAICRVVVAPHSGGEPERKNDASAI